VVTASEISTSTRSPTPDPIGFSAMVVILPVLAGLQIPQLAQAEVETNSTSARDPLISITFPRSSIGIFYHIRLKPGFFCYTIPV